MPSSWLRSAILSVSVAICAGPAFGYHSKDSRAFSMASSRSGAQMAMVKVAAWLLTKAPIGFAQASTAAR